LARAAEHLFLATVLRGFWLKKRLLFKKIIPQGLILELFNTYNFDVFMTFLF